ncbi:MAG: SOS response-associated peptidase family protein [Bulleidia sp.]
MCGRYLFWDSENQNLKKLIDYAEETLPEEQFRKVSKTDACPGNLCFAGVFDRKSSQYRTGLMKWGYGGMKKTVINARNETWRRSPFFLGSQPCVLPCAGYYEWDPSKRKHLIHTDASLMYLGGIWHMENSQPVFVVVTEPADLSILDIHDRQPLLFDRTQALKWCQGMECHSIQTRKAELL